jgi:hypothetical protein
MPDTTGAQFQEMLEVGVDVSVFESGLRQLESVYTDFLQRIQAKGGTGAEVFQIGAVGTLSKDLADLATVIGQVQANLNATLKDITQGVVTTLESFEQTIEDKFVVSSKAKIKQSQEEADSRIEDAKRINKALADEAAVGRAGAASFDGRNAQFNTLTPQRNPAQFDEQDAKAIADRLVLTLNAAKEEQDAYDKVVSQHMAGEAKLAKEREALVAKDSAYQSELADKDAAKRMANEAKLSTYREELASKDAAYQSELADKAAAKQIERDALALRRRQEAEGQFILNKGPQATKEPESAFFSGANFKQMGSDVIGLTETFVKMGAALLIIQAAIAPFRLLADSIKSGWEYMTQLQKSAADLQGVIASNVVLSKDFGDNFKLAGEAAVDITKDLQSFAAKTGIEVTQLNSAFKAVVDGGGASFVTQMSQLGTLAEYFALAVKATGKDFQVQRTLISEIPGLLDGSVSKTSLILRTLGLTKDEWEKIRQSSEEHKNLVEQLEPRLKPYLTVAEQADLRMAAINEQLELMKNQISAAIVTPTWNAWLKILQDAATYVKENKEQFIGIGQSIIGAVVDIGRFVFEIIGAVAQVLLLGASWKDVGQGILIALDMIRTFITYLEFSGSVLSRMVELITSPSTWNSAGLRKFADDIVDIGVKAAEKINKINQETAKALDGSPDASSDKPVLGGKKPAVAPQDHLKEVESKYREELKLTEDFFARRKALQDQALREGRIGEEQHYENVKNLQNAELDRLRQIAAVYSNKADKSGGKSGAIESFKNSITGGIDSQETKVFEQRVKNEEQFAAFKKKLSDIDFKDNLAMIASEKKTELAAAQENGSSKKGLIARLDKEASDQAYKAYEEETNRELAKATTTETEKARLTDELMRKSFEQKSKDTIADGKIAKADLADQVKIAKDLSTEAHQQFNLEAQRVNEADKHKFSQKAILNDQKELAKEYSSLVAQDVKRLDYLIRQAEQVAKQTGDTTELVRLEKERADLQKEQEAANNTVTTNDKKPGTGGKTLEALTGLNDKDLTDGFKDFKTGLATAAKGLGGLANTVSSLINTYKQGAASGGVLGGVGAVAGQVGGIVSSIPGGELIGGAIQGVGAVMGFIGGFFKAAAKKIADEMKKSFDQIVKNYQNGTTNLMDTISQLEAKRQEAINRLSGKKGGQDELKNLLPQFDDEIAALKKAQKELLDSFDNSLAVLRLHSDSLASLLKTWQDINKQVADYIGAGGDAAKAAEFLSLSLQKQREQAVSDLESGESQAIQDAIDLNGLLKQRVELVKQFKQQEFDLMNADSIERRQSGAVTRGQQLAQLRQQNQDQLDSLDQQISLATQKVDLERQVFDISSDINALHRRDEELQLSALSVQISKWKDLQTIINGIVKSLDGTGFALSGNLASAIGAVTTASNIFTVNVGGVVVNGPTSGGGAAIGSDIGDAITLSLQQGVHRLLIA